MNIKTILPPRKQSWVIRFSPTFWPFYFLYSSCPNKNIWIPSSLFSVLKDNFLQSGYPFYFIVFIILEWFRFLPCVCILVLQIMGISENSMVLLLSQNTSALTMCLSFSTEKGKTFWSRNGIAISLLLVSHCLPHCNSNLIFLAIPEFSKRVSWTCSSTMNTD